MLLLVGGVVAVLISARGGTEKQASAPVAAIAGQPGTGATTAAGPVAGENLVSDVAKVPPPKDLPSSGRVVYTYRFADTPQFSHQWRPTVKYAGEKASFDRMLKAIPVGLWAGCYDPKSGGEFVIESLDGVAAFGLASRRAPATAQLSIDAEKVTGGLHVGGQYSATFEYMTRGTPDAHVAWLDPQHNKAAVQHFPATNGEWRTAGLAVSRSTSPLRIVFDSSEVTEAGMFYLRGLVVTHDGPYRDGPKSGLRAAVAADRFVEKSVWVGTAAGNLRQTLTVTERRGDTFRARFEIGTKVDREVGGTIKDGKIAWLAKDVRAARGGGGGDNGGTLGRDKDGEKIDFTWKDGKGASGNFTLRLSQ